MKKLHDISYMMLLVGISTLAFQSCKQQKPERKKIVYINSYHRGHPSSDQIMDAVAESFSENRYEFTSFMMDTKRNPSLEYIQDVAARLSDSVVSIDPDILIVSDDNAVKYMVQPLVKRTTFPVVFCGVNGSAREYELPKEKVTGMLEILPVAEVLMTMKRHYPGMKKLMVLNENTTTSRKEAVLLDTMYRRLGMVAEHKLVDNFDQWKSAFREGNQQCDIIYVVTHGAIKGWHHDEAVNFVRQHIKIPVVTCEDFMMPYVVLGLTKVASEQGYWAAGTAKAILSGRKPSEIPVSRNMRSAVWLNSVLSRKIGFQPPDELFKRASWWPVDPVEK